MIRTWAVAAVCRGFGTVAHRLSRFRSRIIKSGWRFADVERGVAREGDFYGRTKGAFKTLLQKVGDVRLVLDHENPCHPSEDSDGLRAGA